MLLILWRQVFLGALQNNPSSAIDAIYHLNKHTPLGLWYHAFLLNDTQSPFNQAGSLDTFLLDVHLAMVKLKQIKASQPDDSSHSSLDSFGSNLTTDMMQAGVDFDQFIRAQQHI